MGQRRSKARGPVSSLTFQSRTVKRNRPERQNASVDMIQYLSQSFFALLSSFSRLTVGGTTRCRKSKSKGTEDKGALTSASSSQLFSQVLRPQWEDRIERLVR
jgi:hypothetical protein